MWILFFILLILWVLGYFTFHIAGGLIHILLIVAIIVFIVGLFRRKR
ncbi:lmo0937 family membrane protein [Bacillus sp. EAC]|nr:lmo0937 family membrane protein [Bacillus sp. EAC]